MSNSMQRAQEAAPVPKVGARVRVARLVEQACPETLGVGSEGTVDGYVLWDGKKRVLVKMYHGYNLAYLPIELEELK